MSAHALNRELDPNIYRERAALMEAKRISELKDPLARQRAIAQLILNAANPDVNRVGFQAHCEPCRIAYNAKEGK